MRSCGLDSSGSGYGPVAESCEHCNKSSDFIKVGEFPELLSDHQFLKKESSPWI
jgi:hypothetical protein